MSRQVRKTRDPIELSKNRIIEAGFATKEELKDLEKEVPYSLPVLSFLVSARVLLVGSKYRVYSPVLH